MSLLSNTLVLAHGHDHRKIKEIGSDSVLLDVSEEDKPDIIANLGILT